MIIVDIKNVKNKQSRNDNAYLERIGCKVSLMQAPVSGASMILKYHTAHNGTPKTGFLVTSIVTGFEESSTQLIIKTLNSIYVLRKEPSDVHFFDFAT